MLNNSQEARVMTGNGLWNPTSLTGKQGQNCDNEFAFYIFINRRINWIIGLTYLSAVWPIVVVVKRTSPGAIQ